MLFRLARRAPRGAARRITRFSAQAGPLRQRPRRTGGQCRLGDRQRYADPVAGPERHRACDAGDLLDRSDFLLGCGARAARLRGRHQHQRAHLWEWLQSRTTWRTTTCSSWTSPTPCSPAPKPRRSSPSSAAGRAGRRSPTTTVRIATTTASIHRRSGMPSIPGIIRCALRRGRRNQQQHRADLDQREYVGR